MAATEVTDRTNASGASDSAAAGAVARLAALVATSYGRSVQGLAVLEAARGGQSVPPGQERIAGALSSRRSAASPTWKAGAGCPSGRRAVSARSCLLMRSGALPGLARDRGTVHTEGHEHEGSKPFARSGRLALEALCHVIAHDA